MQNNFKVKNCDSYQVPQKQHPVCPIIAEQFPGLQELKNATKSGESGDVIFEASALKKSGSVHSEIKAFYSHDPIFKNPP